MQDVVEDDINWRLRRMSQECHVASGKAHRERTDQHRLRSRAPGRERLKGAVDVAGIVKDNPNSKARGEAAEAIKPTLGPDFDDEDEVPPLM